MHDKGLPFSGYMNLNLYKFMYIMLRKTCQLNINCKTRQQQEKKLELHGCLTSDRISAE